MLIVLKVILVLCIGYIALSAVLSHSTDSSQIVLLAIIATKIVTWDISQ